MTATDKATAPPARKPGDDEIDLYGLTHQGKVRKTNQDHFLICSLRRQIEVHLTSLPDARDLARQDRAAFLAMVADGVGGGAKGEEASRIALHAVTQYVTRSMRCYYAADPNDEKAFPEALMDAAMKTHTEVLGQATGNPGLQGMATTLTLWIGVWPYGYLLQVGDSRCYVLRNSGELIQVSRDQTMAQELVDQGVMSRTDAFNTRWANVLSSSIGGPQTAPSVTRTVSEWGEIGMLCSDGLTKHVPDDRIRERLLEFKTARQACEDLLQDALDAGGTDNITILIARTVAKDR